jgi:hypothetical protein
MYWWHRAALLIESGSARRFGLITTNSIVQDYSRRVLDMHSDRVRLIFAINNHPWPELSDSANVDVAITVVGALSDGSPARLGTVVRSGQEEEGVAVKYATVSVISSSLTASATRDLNKLQANANLCFQGVVPAGEGFKLTPDEKRKLSELGETSPSLIRPYVIGRDLVQVAASKYIVDAFGVTESDLRSKYPKLYQRLLERVKPERDLNNRASYRDKWWLFAEPRPAMRGALKGLDRFIGTPYTAKFRPFVFIPSTTLPDAMVYAIASDDAGVLAVLSSRVHAWFARMAGGSLEDRPRYNSDKVFLPFPFPKQNDIQRQRIRNLGEQLDAHRKRQQELHPDLTITGMYNVLEKLRSGEALTAKEKVIHEQGLVSVLKQIHDDLDAAVFDAYGWRMI